jgi:hypothetical protein
MPWAGTHIRGGLGPSSAGRATSGRQPNSTHSQPRSGRAMAAAHPISLEALPILGWLSVQFAAVPMSGQVTFRALADHRQVMSIWRSNVT